MTVLEVLKHMCIHYLGRVKIEYVVLCLLINTGIVLLKPVSGKKMISTIDVLWILYITFVCSVTLLGRSIGTVDSSVNLMFVTYKNMISGTTTWQHYEVWFNIMLFVPMGIFLSINHNKKQTLGYIFLFSLLIEFTQLVTKTGLFEICDLIDNTIGGLVGIAICNITLHSIRKK